MAKRDDSTAAGLGFLAGLILAAPKEQDRQDIQYGNEYRDRNALLNHLKLNKSIPRLTDEHIREAARLFVRGFFRSACIMSAIAIEIALNEKYQIINGIKKAAPESFKELTDWAEQEGILQHGNTSFIDGVRKLRNAYVHPENLNVTIQDAQLTFGVALRVINHLYPDNFNQNNNNT